MIKLFLSYRREDSQGITGRIYDRLQLIFGHESVFMDVDSIPIGVDFRNHLKESVEQCNVFIAVIGDRWCRDDMKNRLEDPDDYVRLEIEYALAKEIPVIPVLIGRTTMPVPDDLPASIKMLAYRNAVHIDTGKDFSFHIDNLISAVKSLYEETFESNISRNNLLIKTHTSLFFVSNSKDKQEEYKRLLCIQDLKLSEIDVPDIQEMNLELIVRKKIDYVRPILSDAAFFLEHTGLIIDAWKGLPGGLTKAFMKTVGSIGVCKMLQSFKGAERSARAKAIIGFHYKDMVHIFEGSVSGTIALEPRGEYGFGWDNIFIPSGETKTYAELGSESKDKILMRQKAATDFAKNLQDCLT